MLYKSLTIAAFVLLLMAACKKDETKPDLHAMALGTWHETYYGSDDDSNGIWNINERINDSAQGLKMVFILKEHDSCVFIQSWVPPAVVQPADTAYWQWQIPNDTTIVFTYQNQSVGHYAIEALTNHKLLFRADPQLSSPYKLWFQWER